MHASEDKDPKGFGLLSVMFTLVAVMLGVSALFTAAQALKRSDDAKSEALAAAGGTQVTAFIVQ